MKPSTHRVKLASLILGVLAGFALLSLPALLSSGPTSKASSTGTTTPARYAGLESLYGLEKSPGYSVFSVIVFIVLVVLIPAIALSFVAREWAFRRASRS